MAVIDATILGGSPDWEPIGSTLKPPPHGTTVVQWAGMAGGDTGEPVQVGLFGDKSVQASGTIGTTTMLHLQGTNEVDGAGLPINWAALNKPDGTPINLVGLPDLEQVLEVSRFIRPSVGAGTASGIKVSVYGRKTKMASGG